MSSDVSSFSFLQYLTTVLDNIGDSILLIGVEPQGRFKLLITNKRFGSSSGYSHDSIGKYIDEIVTPESYDTVIRRYREVVRHKQPLSYSEWADVPAGRRAYNVKMIPILDSVGECQQLVIITREVSDTILTMQKLKETTKFLQTFAQTMGDAVWLIDGAGTIRFEHGTTTTPHVDKHYSEILQDIGLPKDGVPMTGTLDHINGMTESWNFTLRRSDNSDYYMCIANKTT